MTRNETKEVLMIMSVLYPNFKVKPEMMTPTIDAWYMMLEKYSARDVQQALNIFAATSGSSFAPSVSQLIDCIHRPKENRRTSDSEAWSLVKQAIKDGIYNSEERYAELPALVQKAIGSPTVLRSWAMLDSDEVNTVIMSNFQRSYRTLVERQDFEDRTLIGQNKVDQIEEHN